MSSLEKAFDKSFERSFPKAFSQAFDKSFPEAFDKAIDKNPTINEMKKDISSLQGDIGEMKNDISSLQDNVRHISIIVEGIQSDNRVMLENICNSLNITPEVDKNRSRIDGLEVTTDSLRAALIKHLRDRKVHLAS